MSKRECEYIVTSDSIRTASGSQRFVVDEIIESETHIIGRLDGTLMFAVPLNGASVLIDRINNDA